MIIFIDTNILYNNWHLQNANFIYLFNFLENTNSELFISEIVCDEVDNKFNSELDSLKKSFNDNLKKAKSFIGNSLEFNLTDLDVNFSIKEIINGKSDRVVFFSYDNISNKTLVERAIKKIKPFQSEDKGYRDTLIWLSFLEKISSLKDKSKIAFINNNSSDFFNSDKTSLHDDLKKDLEKYELLNEFCIYESIKDFINKEVNMEQRKYTRNQILENFIYPNERMIEETVEMHINSESANWFSNLIKRHTESYKEIIYLTNYNFHILEGIEDPEVISWSETNENAFFAEICFYLRIVEFEFTIPKAVYLSKQELFNDLSKFYNVEIENDFATLYAIRKVFMNVSFNFDIKENTLSDFVINEFM